MQRLTFDEWFALLSAALPSGADLNRLRTWIGNIRDPAACLAPIDAAAAGRPCPHRGCARVHENSPDTEMSLPNANTAFFILQHGTAGKILP